MNKEEVLQNAKRLIQKGQLTRAEFLDLFNQNKKRFSLNIINILYGIGGIVIFAGVISLLVQSWDTLPSFARILITLGMAIVLYISSVLLVTKRYNILAQILLAVSFVLFPIGIGVMLYELRVDLGIGGISVVSTLLTVFSVLTYFILKKLVVSALAAVIFGTLTSYSLLTYVLDVTDSLGDSLNPYLYLTIFLGIIHGLLAYISHAHRDISIRILGKLFYVTGALGILIGAISLGGFWDVLFIFVVIGTFLLSVYVHSRGMLVLSAIFLIIYLFKITGEYFANSIGWPIALIMIGIATIVVAIGTFKVNQKYFSHATQLRS